MSKLMRRTHIRAHAEEAARSGKGPDACPYGAGSDAEAYWKDVFYATVGLLMIREAGRIPTNSTLPHSGASRFAVHQAG